MSARPNPHARKNEVRESASVVVPTDVGVEANAWASDILVDADLSLDPFRLIRDLDKQPVAQGRQLRGVVMRDASHWLQSPDPSLRLIAAIGYLAEYARPPGMSVEEFRAVFDRVLDESKDERAREVAAYGLAYLYFNAPDEGPADNQVPWAVRSMLPRLANSDTRHAALLGLRIVLENDRLFKKWLSTTGLAEPLRQILNDAAVPIVDQVEAVRITWLTSDVPDLRYQKALSLIQQHDLSSKDAEFLISGLLAQMQLDDFAGIIGDASIPCRRRQRILVALQQYTPEHAPWDAWRALLVEGKLEPELAADLIRFFGMRNHASFQRNLPALLQRADLPLPCRVELFYVLWNNARHLDSQQVLGKPVLQALLDLGSDPDVARSVFPDGNYVAYGGTLGDCSDDYLLAPLRDERLPLSFRYLLLRGVVLRSTPATETIRAGVDVWIRFALTRPPDAPVCSADKLWYDLGSYGLLSDVAARYICEDPRVPVPTRLAQVSRVPRLSLLRLAGDRLLSESERDQVVRAIEKYIPSYYWSNWNHFAADSRPIEELSTIPAFLSDNSDAMVQYCADAKQPTPFRWLAAIWTRMEESRTIPPPSEYADAESAGLPISALALLFSRMDVGSSAWGLCRKRIIAYLTHMGTGSPDGAFLVSFLIHYGQTSIASLCGSEELSPELRREMGQQIARESLPESATDPRGAFLQWSVWKELVLRPTEAGLWGDLVGLFTRYEDPWQWPELLELAQRSDLPVEVRARLFSGIWAHAGRIERDLAGREPLFDALLNLGADPAVLRDAFPSQCMPPYGGRIPSDAVRRLLSICRDQSKPLFYRFFFAACVSEEVELSPSDRHDVVELLIVGSHQAEWGASMFLSRVRESVLRHALADPALARRLLVDDRMSETAVREILKKTDFQSVVWLLRQEQPARCDHSFACQMLQRHVPPQIWQETYQNLLDRGDLWREIISTPAFIEYDATSLHAVALDPQRSLLARRIARHQALVAACESPRRTADLFRDLVADMTRGAHAPSELTFRFGYLESLLIVQRMNEEVVDSLIPIVTHSAIPLEFKAKLLSKLSPECFRKHACRFWEGLTVGQDPEVCTLIFKTFVQAGCFLTTSIVSQINDAWRDASTTEEQAAARQRWQVIARLGVLLRANLVDLIKIAGDPDESAFVRANALHWLTHTPDGGYPAIRALWAFVATPAGRRLWEDASDRKLRQFVIGKLMTSFPNTRFSEVVSAGPAGPFWDSFVQIALLPDQELAKQTLARLHVVPSETSWVLWPKNVVSDVPAAARLLLVQLYPVLSAESRGVPIFTQAFAACRGKHSRSAELTSAQLIGAPRSVQERVRAIVERCALSALETPDEKDRFVDDLIRVLHFAPMEAQLADSEPGSAGENGDYRATFADSAPIGDLADSLRAAIIRCIQPFLPQVTSQQLVKVLSQTEAPALLVGHYLRVHPDGLPLLANAIGAYGEGTDQWKNWRYDRPEARQQLAHLNDDQRASWRQNRDLPVASTDVPEDVKYAAIHIQARLRRACRDGAVPEDLESLICGALRGEISAPNQIRAYAELNRHLGHCLEGKLAISELLTRADLPDSLRRALHALPEQPLQTRQSLLTWRHRIDRAIDLLRLLNCDESALARNVLLAKGEPEDKIPQTRGAVAHLEQLRYALSHAPTRQRSSEIMSPPTQLLAALADAHNALQSITSFASGRDFVAFESDDFTTLIEIGHRPYGQGSCQNYDGRNEYNRALLAYVVDAMTKVIVIRTESTPENPRGTCLARAIVRLGKNEADGTPVILLERTYAAGREITLYDALIHKAARAFAADRGWKLVTPDFLSDSAPDARILVRIPASQNGVQYEDGADAMEGGRDVLPGSGYVLRTIEVIDRS